MAMVMAPPDPTDCLRLADWMEVETLVAPQRSASRTEVLSLLRIGAVGDQTDEDRIILDAFGELERRSIAADSSYPFIVDGSLLTLRSDNWRNDAAYVFCLLVSYKPRKPSGVRITSPEKEHWPLAMNNRTRKIFYPTFLISTSDMSSSGFPVVNDRILSLPQH